MEIPTEEIIEQLEQIIPKDIESGQVTEKTVKLKLDTIQLIQAQAREILDLQATICRLKAEHSEQLEREHLERMVDAEARRIRDLGDD